MSDSAAAAVLWAACLALAVPEARAETGADQADEAGGAGMPASDPELETGLRLYAAESGAWDLRLIFPFSVGLTQFDLDSGISLDDVTTVSLVPTLEAIVPLDERWTFQPFAGAGGAAAVGDQKPVSGESTIGILTGGLRAQRWQPFGGRYVSVVTAEARYNAALTPRDGLLGDWGSLTGAVELRHSFGAPGAGPRFQAGLYAKGFWYWDPVEIEIPGVTPTFLHNQQEFGISLGSTTPVKIWGLTLPRVFIGARSGGDLRSLQLSFGRL